MLSGAKRMAYLLAPSNGLPSASTPTIDIDHFLFLMGGAARHNDRRAVQIVVLQIIPRADDFADREFAGV